MKVKITPKITLTLEIDGEHVDGTFKLDGIWNGLACLRGTGGQVQSVVIKQPAISHLNVYDAVLKVFGGNAQSDADIKPVEAEGVTKTFELPSESRERRRKQMAADQDKASAGTIAAP